MIQALTRVLEVGLSRRNLTPSGPVGLDKLDGFLDWLAGTSADGNNWAGSAVTTRSALGIPAHYACVNVISGSLAQIPMIVYRVDPDTGQRERYRTHYLYRTLKDHWNPYMTAFRGKRQLQSWLSNQGNAFAYLEINGRGQVVNLWPWRPDRVEMKPLGAVLETQNIDMPMEMDPNQPMYRYRGGDNSYTRWEPWHNILHLRGMESDGFWGLSPIEIHRQTMSLALAMKEHTARFYTNGGRPLGVLTHPGTLDNVDKVRAAWQKVHGGMSNAHKIAILEEGMKYQEIGLTPVAAQYAETEKLSAIDFCRIHNVPPHKIFELSRSTNNNIEHQGTEWSEDGIGPWICNWEAEFNHCLLSDRESETVEIEFYDNPLKRADAAGRAAYLSKALGGAPWMVQDEARHSEGLNPMRTPEAQNFPVTVNAPGTVAPDQKPGKTPPEDDQED